MELPGAIEEYKKATEAFIAVVSKLTEVELDKPQNDSWTARQVVHHVADSEAKSYARLRRLIAEPGAQPKDIQDFVGHESIIETMDTYGHLFPVSKFKIADFIDAIADESADQKTIYAAG